jgi:hypothetical protein
MKNYLYCIYILGLCAVISCSNKSNGVTSDAQNNLTIQHGIRDAMAGKNLNELDKFISADAVDHSGDHGDIHGIDSIKLQIQSWKDMADENIQIIKELSDDQYLMSWGRHTGKYKNTGYGHKPGDTFDVQEIEVIRFKDGKAVEHWSMMPPADVMKMMASTTAPVTMDRAVLTEDSVRMKAKGK